MKEKVLKYYQHYMYLMGFGGHLIFVFQAYKIWQTQSSVDVSLFGFLSCFWAVCSWFVYGLLINNSVLIRVNAFGICAGIICLAMILAYA
ncbi:MAG TPA: SemiSWEET family transporter [Candidatus Saccharimonadales bacterium]|nr:SemiSWEET family transporter [Candidatus Saccharimonadales bacterium]